MFERRGSKPPPKAWSPYSTIETNEEEKKDTSKSSKRKTAISTNSPRISVRPQSAAMSSQELFSI